MGTTSASSNRTSASRRTTVVWCALAGAMTLGTGVLSMMPSGHAPRQDGLRLTPLVATPGGSSVEAVFATRQKLDRDRWTSITIHHSASPFGDPASLDAEAQRMKLKGLGYHFVIGNGRGMDDGEVHVAYRWLDQLPGAHVAGPRSAEMNQRSIGICLVGDGDRGSFTEAQVSRLAELVGALCDELGLDPRDVKLHRDLAGTTSPGRLFPEAAFRERLMALR